MNILVIIDPQVDFVTGSLAVPGAVEAMQWLAGWIAEHADELDAVAVSMDQHPMNHCSFVAQGGPWPSHCVRYSEGAAIEGGILAQLTALQAKGKNIYFIEKATTAEEDSYSAFATGVPECLRSAERVYLAGLAGDYCVAASQADLVKSVPIEKLHRLEEGIAWIQKPE